MTAKLQLHPALRTRALCARLALPCSTLRRWRARSAQNRPLITPPGPKKLGPLPFEEVRRGVEGLLHGQERSRGSGALYHRYREVISRRRLGQWIGQQRQSIIQIRRHNYRSIRWKEPNLAWAIDATEYGKDQHGHRLFLIVTIDLASRYTFRPLVTLNPSSQEVAEYLRSLFVRHGPPLFLKRDNGSIFNHQILDQLLAQQAVIPLNSPTYYPRYNGGIEKSIRELKASLHCFLPQPPAAWKPAAIADFATAAAHLRNCAPRRCLRRCTAAQTYHPQPISRFTKRQRHATFLWIKRRCAGILASVHLPNRHHARAAWRSASQLWLQRHNLITIHLKQTIHIN
jgi:hypothetical protein